MQRSKEMAPRARFELATLRFIRLCEKPIRSDPSSGFAFTFFTFACLAHVPEM